VHQAWGLEADKKVTGEDDFTMARQEGTVLVTFVVQYGEGDNRCGKGIVIDWHPIEPLGDVALSRGDKVSVSLILVIVGMEGFVFNRLKLVSHNTRHWSWGR